jgi:hypothetical protein
VISFSSDLPDLDDILEEITEATSTTAHLSRLIFWCKLKYLRGTFDDISGALLTNL